MRETHLLSLKMLLSSYMFICHTSKMRIPASQVIILLTLAPFIKFTLLGPQATDGHGRWIVVACLVGVQQLHAS